MKIIVLVIASRSNVYDEFKKTWGKNQEFCDRHAARKGMGSHPK